MRIGIQTWGSDGDIRPFIALAGGLRKAGHQVTLGVASVDGKDYSPLAAALDFRIIHYRSSHQAVFEKAEKAIHARTLLMQFKFIGDALSLSQDEMYVSGLEMGGNCDLLIGHFAVGSFKAVAERLGVSYCSVHLAHMAILHRTGYR